jgi:hypothetical protein
MTRPPAIPGRRAWENRAVEKIDEHWSCDVCHEEAVTVAWRTEEAPDLEPVDVRARCPICGNVKELSFRPGTDPNTEETYTLWEWMRRGETEQASRHSVDLEPDVPAPPEGASPDVGLTEDELLSFEVKASQCQPPHVASTWTLVPPVNEWYAADVPRLVEEVRRLNPRLVKGGAPPVPGPRGGG